MSKQVFISGQRVSVSDMNKIANRTVVSYADKAARTADTGAVWAFMLDTKKLTVKIGTKWYESAAFTAET